MKIQKISLQNFKFHHDLSFEINKQNSLIYGENGTGKSSLYEALYVNFYYSKNTNIIQEKLDIREKYKHRDYAQDLKVDITFDNGITLNRIDNTLENSEVLKDQTIYFANERVLRKITEQNFYDVIKQVLVEHFRKLRELTTLYNSLKLQLKEEYDGSEKKRLEFIEEKINNDKKLQDTFQRLIPVDKINDILQNNFDEKNFEIEFIIKDSEINFVNDEATLIEPTITIKVKNIDDKGDLEAHFNEGRLKLISIAIYFALAKEYELDSSIKLLVLDDFLTSLDMANRKLIIRYILDDFAEYQKIILTHNIQFFNLIIKLLNMREEKEAWDIKNIFLFEKDKKESADINNKDNSYLQSSRKQLLLGEYHISGNYARKEFERIINEFKQILEIGKMEQLNSILEILKSTSKEDKFYKKPFLVISKLNTRFLNILNILESTQNVHEALGKIKYETKEIKNFLETEKCELLNLKELLTKTEFYKNILFNPTSHSNENIEVYRKECINSIKLLEKLNEILNQLK